MRRIDVSDVLVLAGLICLGAAVYLLAGAVGTLAFVGALLTVFGVVGAIARMNRMRHN